MMAPSTCIARAPTQCAACPKLRTDSELQALFPRLSSGQDDFVDDLCGQLQQFASDGLRTLCVAYKELDKADWALWEAQWKEVSAAERAASSS